EDAAGDVARRRAREPGDDRRYPARMQPRLLLLAALADTEVFGEPRERPRSDRVHGNAVAGELPRRDDRERGDARLGGAVVRLPGVPVDTRYGGRVDETRTDRLALLRAVAPVGRRMVGRSERALEVDLDDSVPLALGHVHEHAVAEDARVVYQHVEAAERRDRLLDHLLRSGEIADVTRVRNRL